MYFLIIIILSIFLFYFLKQFNCLKIARNYQKNRDSKNAIKYYLQDINNNETVLLSTAIKYHYTDKNLFQAIQYYYLYLTFIKKKNDIISKKNRLFAHNKINEILEHFNLNNINSIDNYLLNNILDKSDDNITPQPLLYNNQNIVVDNSILDDINNYLIDEENVEIEENVERIDEFPIHRPILNDNQNIHDTYVNNTIQNSINNIKTNQSISNKINLNINEINNIIKDEINKQNFDNIKKNNILNVLESININSTKSYKNNMTLSELLILIFNRIYNEYNEDIQKTFLSNLILELNDCVENNNIVCHTGIFNRIINSINLLDINVNIKTYDFLNEEIMNKCIAIRNTLDINIYDNESDENEYNNSLKNKIRLEMNKDYVETKILTQSQLDDILNIWIDHL
jgi:hypothetical protein